MSGVRDKLVIPAIASVLVAGLTAWGTAAAAPRGVSTDEVRNIMRTESPYVQDRSLLLQTLARHERLLVKIDGEVRQVQLILARQGR